MVIIQRRWLSCLKRMSALMFALLFCWLVGHQISPSTPAGRPFLFTPAIRAVIQYRQHAAQWTAVMLDLDQDMGNLLEKPLNDPYELSSRVDIILAKSIRLSELIKSTPAPAALMGLQEMCDIAAAAHVAAAEAIGRWAGAPSTDNLYVAIDVLTNAEETVTELYQSPWLTQTHNEGQNPSLRYEDSLPNAVWGE